MGIGIDGGRSLGQKRADSLACNGVELHDHVAQKQQHGRAHKLCQLRVRRQAARPDAVEPAAAKDQNHKLQNLGGVGRPDQHRDAEFAAKQQHRCHGKDVEEHAVELARGEKPLGIEHGGIVCLGNGQGQHRGKQPQIDRKAVQLCPFIAGGKDPGQGPGKGNDETREQHGNELKKQHSPGGQLFCSLFSIPGLDQDVGCDQGRDQRLGDGSADGGDEVARDKVEVCGCVRAEDPGDRSLAHKAQNLGQQQQHDHCQRGAVERSFLSHGRDPSAFQ